MIIHTAIAHKAAVAKLAPSDNDANTAKADGQDAQQVAHRLNPRRALVEHTFNAGQHQQSFTAQSFGRLRSNANAIELAHQLSVESAAYQSRVPMQAQRYETRFRQAFTSLANSQSQFHQLLQSVYGVNINTEAAEQLRQKVLIGNFTWLPQIIFTDAEKLNGANGAYAAEPNTIYLSNVLLNSTTPVAEEQLYRVLVEEFGHSIDNLLNSQDAIGDEGALFSIKLAGTQMSNTELLSIMAEDDSGHINVDGVHVVVEYSKLSKELGRFSNRVKGFFDKFRAVAQAFADRVQAIHAATLDMASDVGRVVGVVLKRPFEITADIISGVVAMTKLVAAGKILQAGTMFRESLINSGQLALSLIPEVVAMSVSAAIMAIDRARGAISERALSATEQAYLFQVFGSSLDYRKITIVRDGLKDQLGMDANVVGNEIFMSNKLSDGTQTFNPDGSLTSGGLALLAHEAAHVWQFQNEGAAYIGESLVHQLYDGDQDTYNWYHAVNNGTTFRQMNPEQQAEIARLIGQAITHQIANEQAGVLTLDALNAVIHSSQKEITADQFHLFVQAHAVLNPHIELAMVESAQMVGQFRFNHRFEAA